MSDPPALRIVHVLHASKVAAIPSAAGPRRLMDAGLAAALEAAGVAVDAVEVPGPRDPMGEVGAAFAVADGVAREVRRAAADGRLALVLSGSCHVGLGALAGVPGRSRGVLWLDAHGDFNTPETTTSGLLDGTVLAGITGRCWRWMCAGVSGFGPVPDENVILVGVRELDAPEAELLEGSDITVVRAADAEARLPAALAGLAGRTDGVYVHVDLDVLDPSVGRANAFATDGGLDVDGLCSVMGAAVGACAVGAVGFASYDPEADEDGAVARAALEAARGVARALG